MGLRLIFVLSLLMSLAQACMLDRDEITPTPMATLTLIPSSEGEIVEENDIMTEAGFESGPIPANLKDWLEKWDNLALPPEALLKFQVVSRGPDQSGNYRWLLYEDGRWFMVRHSGNKSRREPPFDRDLPDRPTAQLPAETVDEVKAQLQAANFLAEPAYQIDRGVRGGSLYIITARIDGEIHRVIYDAAYPPLVEFLDELTYTHE